MYKKYLSWPNPFKKEGTSSAIGSTTFYMFIPPTYSCMIQTKQSDMQWPRFTVQYLSDRVIKQ